MFSIFLKDVDLRASFSVHNALVRSTRIPYKMTYYFYWHFLLSLGLWSCAIICSLGSRDDPELHSVVAPRLFSIGYPYGLETNERSNLGPRPQTETQILDFVRERHSKNHEDSRSDSIDIFYDSVGGTDVIDAWIARLTDEDILEFQESFLVSAIYDD